MNMNKYLLCEIATLKSQILHSILFLCLYCIGISIVLLSFTCFYGIKCTYEYFKQPPDFKPKWVYNNYIIKGKYSTEKHIKRY